MINSLAMTSLRVRLSVIYAMGDQTKVILSPFNSSDCPSQVKYYHTVKTKGGGGSHVARLNFKTSRVGVYKCFLWLSENERKFFVFVGILEKRDSDAL